MIQLRNITKTYAGTGPAAKAGRPAEVRAVDNLSLDVRRGEIFGFLGPNGAGKTTTIKMITGILRPDETPGASVMVGGADMLADPVRTKALIGYVSDNHETFDRLTGWEYLHFIADVYGVSAAERKRIAGRYLEMFEITDAASGLIKGFSHGMKQKLMLTGALLHSPPLWILDEPMVGLDPKSALALKEEMRAHCGRGNTVFFSTHILEVAERLCDRIGIIYGGRLVAAGTLDELRAMGQRGGTLEQIFFQLTEPG